MSKNKKDEKETNKDNEKTDVEKADAKIDTPPPSAPVIPPLSAAARRLERSLGGEKDKDRLLFTNPTKIVRRWLSTSSGAAGGATFDDIVKAATELLDPRGPCAGGREILTTKLGALTTAATAMDVDETSNEEKKVEEDDGGKKGEKIVFLSTAADREVESWLISIGVRLLFREKKFTDAFELSQEGISILIKHLNATDAGTSIMSSTKSLFPLLARMFRLRSLAAESITTSGDLAAGLRIDMAKAHNLACLRRDVDCQATLLNLMLRDLLLHSQVEQAQKLLANSTFPDSASNNQLCRFLYYSGRIQALRLEYTSAYSNLSQCLRKAPTNTGIGFRIAVQRLLVVVQLLMGEIPDRAVFYSKGMKTELLPYLNITQAVRQGDLVVFKKVASENAKQLQQDDTFTLISRLAHQVVKTGLRKLHVSYSRLSLQDVADRLGLPSAKSAEFVVAKAVRDGVLDATIHHEEQYVQSHDLVDVYATKEPAEAFHRRIAYCLTTHNDAVRGMRYPPDAYKKQLEASRGNRKKRSDDKTDEEKLQELEEELDEDY